MKAMARRYVLTVENDGVPSPDNARHGGALLNAKGWQPETRPVESTPPMSR